MTSINVTNARKNLFAILEQVQGSYEPLVITGRKGAAVLLSEENWRAIEETLYLTSIPGLRQSIIKGLREDPKNCAKILKW
ncbi:MAG: type II toxin-antitoxin system Phd/YefM family antitoxin [Candidatus Margulisbacteria bacterium]|jgi:prevent-host-death family protein|nr:type II toxin-antitoxin system Phd/YefM family antitoxin [Candidatus Margulisiibacteriota bacterium]